jgi:hypothetical protein
MGSFCVLYVCDQNLNGPLCVAGTNSRELQDRAVGRGQTQLGIQLPGVKLVFLLAE